MVKTDLTDTGISSLADPTGLFLSRHATPVPGTCITVTLEGRRPLLGEVQALVDKKWDRYGLGPFIANEGKKR